MPIPKFNKDFFEKLPNEYVVILEHYIERNRLKPAFSLAWEEYRKYILKLKDPKKLKQPRFFFKKYKEII